MDPPKNTFRAERQSHCFGEPACWVKREFGPPPQVPEERCSIRPLLGLHVHFFYGSRPGWAPASLHEFALRRVSRAPQVPRLDHGTCQAGTRHEELRRATGSARRGRQAGVGETRGLREASSISEGTGTSSNFIAPLAHPLGTGKGGKGMLKREPIRF